MVGMNDIKQKDNIFRCDCYPEDSHKKSYLKFDDEKQEIL